MMDTNTILAALGSVGVIVTSIYAVIKFWMRLSDRITNADGKAEAAETAANNANIAATAARLEIDRLKNELVEHRVAVAREYVSKDTLATLESRVIDAINSLGQRLDNLFKQQTAR